MPRPVAPRGCPCNARVSLRFGRSKNDKMYLGFEAATRVDQEFAAESVVACADELVRFSGS